jgi:hypothetical protein
VTDPGDESTRLRLDEEKIQILRRWGEGLQDVGGAELRAAGRAIVLLVEEVERLHVDLWHAKSALNRPMPDEIEEAEPLAATLRDRLRRRFAPAGDSPAQRRRGLQAAEPEGLADVDETPE